MKIPQKHFINILITERDKDMLRLLNRLKIAESRILRIILSPTTSQNTFTSRLQKLEEKGYIQTINPDRSRNQYKIYTLTHDIHKLKEIELIIGEKTEGGRYTHSHTYFYHTLYISYLLAYLIERFRKKNQSYIFKTQDYVSQFIIQGFVNQRDEMSLIKNRENHMIPDGILRYQDLTIWLEVERKNSNKQFKEKIRGYEEQTYYLKSEGFSEFFKKENMHGIVIMCPSWKMEGYKEIITKIDIRDAYTVTFIDEDKIIDSF